MSTLDSLQKVMDVDESSMEGVKGYEQQETIRNIIKNYKAGNITEEQTLVLRKYYEDVRKEFYAKKAGLSTTPKPVARVMNTP